MEKKYLPCSARRYHITKHGVVYYGQNEVEVSMLNGELYVQLDWVSGRALYNVATLMLVTYLTTELPDHLYEKIRPLYKDGDKGNLKIENLCYDFGDKPLEVEDYPGFFYIPGYSLYAISSVGDLINWKTGKYKTWSIVHPKKDKYATGTYSYNRVIRDDGVSCTLFKHRALCLAHKPLGVCVDDYVVDHVDTNTKNNKLDNLEWVTYQENLLRAYRTGLRPRSSKPIDMLNLETGEVSQFETVQSAVDYISEKKLMTQTCTVTLIHYRIAKCKGKVFPDKLVFKCRDEEWPPEIIQGTYKECRAGRGESIVARNVYTGVLSIFDNCRVASDFTQVKSATILSHVNKQTDIPVNGYNFRYLSESKEWPHHSEKNLIIYKAFPVYPPNGVIATNLETGDEIFFESAARCFNAFNLSKSGLHGVLDTAKSIKGHTFRTYDIRENLGPGLIKLDQAPS